VGLQFGDVPVGLVKMLLLPCAIHGFAPTTDTLRVKSSDRSWAGPDPGQYNWAGNLRPRDVR
jgi:hypothetical protein